MVLFNELPVKMKYPMMKNELKPPQSVPDLQFLVREWLNNILNENSKSKDESALINEVVSVLRDGEVIAFTGAGISTASGIPDYRGPSGVWRVFDPKDFTIDVFLSDPSYYWSRRIERKKVFGVDLLKVLPNPAHKAMTNLQQRGLLLQIITQNTDGLHQKAGSKDVIELHGNASQCKCLKCGTLYSTVIAEEFAERSKRPPVCEKCDYPLKPDVVLFGESLDVSKLDSAEKAVANCKSMIVVGTTAAVYPAAAFPRLAKSRGSKIIEINQEETELTNSISDVSVLGDCSELLPYIVEKVLEGMN